MQNQAAHFAPRLSDIRSWLFRTATPRQILLRVGFDFVLAHAALFLCAVLWLSVSGKITLDSSLGYIVERINRMILTNMGWFTVTAIGLFAAAGLYRPLPSARIVKRIAAVLRACLAGFILHAAVGHLVLHNSVKVLSATGLAWTLLFLLVSASRFSRMSIGRRFRVVPLRSLADGKIEDVLVVGGAGYIGSVLTRQLLNAGYRVRILDLELFGIESLTSMLSHPRLEVIHGDFRNVSDVVRALRDMDAVVHLAAIVGDPACAVDEETTIAINYAAAKMMAQLARANGISRFLFASTCSVYGASEEIMHEESGLNPVSLYATTKIDAERALLEARDDVFQPTILRFATAYGWSQRPRFDLVANLLSAQAVTDHKITIFNGEQWRPFVHTRDLARAMLMVLEAPFSKVGGQIFNVGDESQNYTLTQLGQIVAAAAPGTVVQEIENADDARNYRVNFEKIRKTLGFQAAVTLEDGIREIVHAVNSGAVADWRDPVFSNRRHLEDHGLRVLRMDPTTETDGSHELQATREFLAKAA